MRENNMSAVISWDITSELLKTKVHSEYKFCLSYNACVEKCGPFRATRGERIFQSIHVTYCDIFFLICTPAALIPFFPTCKSHGYKLAFVSWVLFVFRGFFFWLLHTV